MVESGIPPPKRNTGAMSSYTGNFAFAIYKEYQIRALDPT